MYKYLLIFIVLLTGCSFIEHKAYYAKPNLLFAYQSQLGIKASFVGNAVPIDIRLVDEYYKLMSICVTGKIVPVDFIIITHEKMLEGLTIFYKDKIPEVYIRYPKNADETRVFMVLAHEMIHVILQAAGEPIEHNINHISPAFKCAT